MQGLAGLVPPPLQEEAGLIVSDVGEKLRLLRTLTTTMAAWMPQLAALDVDMPSDDVTSQVGKYLDLIGMIEGGASQL